MDRPLALVVDDDVDISTIFSKALEAAGFRTDVCGSGDAALGLLASKPPDLVILDLGLPGMSGLDILHHIRATMTPKTIVIVITANQGMVHRIQGQANIVLLKPVSYSQLRETAKTVWSFRADSCPVL